MLPLILSIVGGLAGPIASAIAGSKTEDEARKAVGPKYNAMIARLVGEGLGHVEARKAADEAIAPEIERVRSEGALPAWAETALGLAGGIGGWAAGAKLAGKAAAKALAKGAAAEVKAAPKVIEGATRPKKINYRAADKEGQDLPKGREREEFFEDEPASMVGDNETLEKIKEVQGVLAPFPKRGPVRSGSGQPALDFSPEAMPMTPREEFRDLLRQETRKEPKRPPELMGAFPPRIGLDKDAYMAEQMGLSPQGF